MSCFALPQFLAWLHRQQPNCCCKDSECAGSIELHHLPQKSKGSIASDYKVIPVCQAHHALIQCWSIEKVNAVYSLDVVRLQENDLRAWLTSLMDESGLIVLAPSRRKSGKRKLSDGLTKTVVKHE